MIPQATALPCWGWIFGIESLIKGHLLGYQCCPRSSAFALRQGDESKDVMFLRRFSIRMRSSASLAMPLRGLTRIHTLPLYLTGGNTAGYAFLANESQSVTKGKNDLFDTRVLLYIVVEGNDAMRLLVFLIRGIDDMTVP